jgi:hypothetical protein
MKSDHFQNTHGPEVHNMEIWETIVSEIPGRVTHYFSIQGLFAAAAAACAAAEDDPPAVCLFAKNDIVVYFQVCATDVLSCR